MPRNQSILLKKKVKILVGLGARERVIETILLSGVPPLLGVGVITKAG